MTWFLSRLLHAAGYGAPATPQAPETTPDSPRPLRFGVLGAANIAPFALIHPARFVGDRVVVTAVAARDAARAAKFAASHGIPKSYGSYAALLADPDIDAVYVPSPNGLHYAWVVRALEAGKHVLCEKPIASNADEARAMVAAAEAAGRVVMEAAHCFHHPAMLRAREIVRSGELGAVERVEAVMEIPGFFIPSSDIRYNNAGTDAKLAGGATMDVGSYVTNCVRFLADAEVASVVSAKATERFPGVDQAMEAELTFRDSRVTGGIVGTMTAGVSKGFWVNRARVRGANGTLTVSNYVMAGLFHRIDVDVAGKRRTEHVYGSPARSTYEHQLIVFSDAVRAAAAAGGRGGAARTTTGGVIDDFVGCMEAIDAVYEKSGLGRRVGYALDEVR